MDQTTVRDFATTWCNAPGTGTRFLAVDSSISFTRRCVRDDGHPQRARCSSIDDKVQTPHSSAIRQMLLLCWSAAAAAADPSTSDAAHCCRRPSSISPAPSAATVALDASYANHATLQPALVPVPGNGAAVQWQSWSEDSWMAAASAVCDCCLRRAPMADARAAAANMTTTPTAALAAGTYRSASEDRQSPPTRVYSAQPHAAWPQLSSSSATFGKLAGVLGAENEPIHDACLGATFVSPSVYLTSSCTRPAARCPWGLQWAHGLLSSAGTPSACGTEHALAKQSRSARTACTCTTPTIGSHQSAGRCCTEFHWHSEPCQSVSATITSSPLPLSAALVSSGVSPDAAVSAAFMPAAWPPPAECASPRPTRAARHPSACSSTRARLTPRPRRRPCAPRSRTSTPT